MCLSDCFSRLWNAVVSFFKSITVEPAYLIFAISQGLYVIVAAELYISKVCKVNLALGEEVCENIQQHKEEQVAVQKYVSTLRIYNSLLQAVPSVIFALFAGPWSDTNGRKFLIMSSIFGCVFNNLVFMINTHFFYELKAEYLLFECLQDCTGGFVVFFMSVNAYLADITEPQHRTKRVAFMTGLWPIGFNVGKALSGLIKSRLGFMYNFGIGMLLAVVSMCYVMIFVRDSIKIREMRLERERQHEVGNDDFDPAEAIEILEEEEKSSESEWSRLKRKLVSLFDVSNLKEGFRALFLKRRHNLRTYLILMIFCFEMEMFINVGEWGSSYLYLRRKLEFTMGDFTRYTTILGVIGIVAQYITIPVFSEKFGLHDATIVLIDITGCFIQTMIMAFVTAEWMLYLGGAIAFLDATSFSMIRCMISKYVRPDEVGKILSVVGAIQAFVPIISSPLFGVLYRSTVETLPQTFLLVLAGCFVIDWLALVAINHGVRNVDRKMNLILGKELDDAPELEKLNKGTAAAEKEKEEGDEKDNNTHL